MNEDDFLIYGDDGTIESDIQEIELEKSEDDSLILGEENISLQD